MSYRSLDIWVLARDLDIAVHRMTLESLPKYQLYEIGAQVRRSVHSIRSNIVEGYGRRRYKQEFIRYLTFALASSDETRDHLDTLFEVGALADQQLYYTLIDLSEQLGKKLNLFLQAVDRTHLPAKE